MDQRPGIAPSYTSRKLLVPLAIGAVVWAVLLLIGYVLYSWVT